MLWLPIEVLHISNINPTATHYKINILLPVASVMYTAGELEAVTNLRTTDGPGQILITWQPPFTFNLTDRPYSVTYCIDIDDSSGKHYVSACNITETQYIFKIVSEINISLTIIVTPENSLGRGKEQKLNASVINIIYN